MSNASTAFDTTGWLAPTVARHAARTSLGNALAAGGRLAEAEVVARSNLETATAVYGAEHRFTLGTTHNLGLLLEQSAPAHLERKPGCRSSPASSYWAGSADPQSAWAPTESSVQTFRHTSSDSWQGSASATHACAPGAVSDDKGYKSSAQPSYSSLLGPRGP